MNADDHPRHPRVPLSGGGDGEIAGDARAGDGGVAGDSRVGDGDTHPRHPRGPHPRHPRVPSSGGGDRAGDGEVTGDGETTTDTFGAMVDEVRAFHAKHRFADLGGEDMVYRVALMAEELGEISACVTKGRPKAELAEECADLLILLLGNAIAADFDLARAFHAKMDAINQRGSRIVDGRVRVSRWNSGDGESTTKP